MNIWEKRFSLKKFFLKLNCHDFQTRFLLNVQIGFQNFFLKTLLKKLDNQGHALKVTVLILLFWLVVTKLLEKK